MRIVWDEPKRLANLDRHGLDFATFEAGFDFGAYLVLPAAPSRTGRPRHRLVGTSGQTLVCAVVSPLGSEALSLVSLRPASPRERTLYVQTI